ncbi:6-bladed beta-propeller [uncultured Piscinibacter sp.]|uniref:6-bladed beta-propeller n=1 Tax=uncultured Piscinibacter sp. TaxID=1131835 RepID=UPI00260A0AD1|nr:6-bladed beta-propeller [uncultured Piscinibacter sp.]
MRRLAPTALLAVAALALLQSCAQAPSASKDATPREIVFPAPPDEPRFVFERTIRSSADILPEEAGSELRRLVTGEQTSGEALSKPYAVAVFRGRIFVSDTVARYVRVFDVPAGKQSKIGDEEGQGQLIKPIGLDVDAAGNLYVADIGAKAVMVYGADGRFLRKIGGDKWFSRLSSVTVDPAGARVYAVDLGGVSSEQHQVRVFDATTGAHLQDIGKRGSGPGEFNLPRDLAIGKDGRLYVVDGGNFRVVVFDREGRYLHSFGSVGKQYGQFARPKEVAIDREGNVYVVDTAFGNFQIFNADGELLLFVGDRSERDGPAKYMLPSGIAVDEDGRVLVVDQWFRKIDVYRPHRLAERSGFLARPVAAAK